MLMVAVLVCFVFFGFLWLIVLEGRKVNEVGIRV